MESDHDTLRRVLRAGPSALARPLGDPAIISAFRAPEAPETTPLVAETLIADKQMQPPSFDVFAEGDEVLIVGELPGVKAAQIRVYGYAAQVVVHVPGSRYSMRLPLRIEPSLVSYTFHNRILAIRACSSVAE